MPKSKGARLSLTMPAPSSYEATEHTKASVTSPGSAMSPGSALSSGTASGFNRRFEEVGSIDSALPTPPWEKRTVDLSKHPTTPAFTSLPPVPSSPSPRHGRQASRSFFSSSNKTPRPSVSSPISIHAKKSSGGTEASPARPSTTTDPLQGRRHAGAEEGHATDPHELATLRASSATPSSGYRNNDHPPLPDRPAPEPIDTSRAPYRTAPSLPHTPGAKKSGSVFGFMKRHPSYQHYHNGELASPVADNDHPRPVHTPEEHGDLAMNPLAANDPEQLLASSKSGFFKALKTGTNKAVSGYKKGRERFRKAPPRPISSPLSPQPKQLPDPEYEMQILYRPLLDQVRLTRIAPRLEQSRDKTEFWLPSLPWRCIDYLNQKGVDEEGIYRHSGSQIQINFYKQKFDRERDVDLYDEPDLYDVNTVSSLLKAWFRDLPDELFPSHLQDTLIAAHGSEAGAPQRLREMISELEPWRYYLLFAITCHLTLISGASDRNKMSTENLYTCIGRSLRIERVVFLWLVSDWRNCWAGCSQEGAFLDAEYAWLADDTAQLEGDISNPPSRQQDLANLSMPPSLQPDRASSPSSQLSGRGNSPDSRLGSSSSRANLQQDITYSASGSQSNLSTGAGKISGSRKASATEHTGTGPSRSFADRMQLQNAGPSAGVREPSPLGRRPAKQEGSSSEQSRSSRQRAQSQSRADAGQQRGKSPGSSSGRRRPRGDTVHSTTASTRSPSQSSEAYHETTANSNSNRSVSGLRKKEGVATPQVPVMSREKIESLERQRERSRQRSRQRSEGGVGGDSRSDEGREQPREKDLPPQLEALRLDLGSIEYESAMQGSGPESGMDTTNSKDLDKKTSAGKHGRKTSKFRLSAPKFPAPLSPTFRGTP